MRAIVKGSAKPGDLLLMDVPVPDIDENELLVKVHAVGVGIHDGYFHPSDIQYPYTIGIEAAGVVVKTGANVRDHRVGDRIGFISSMQKKGGTWAECCAVSKDSLIVKIPPSMSFAEAAAIPVAGNTALRALLSLPLSKGDAVFIAGASGAIGTFAIQLAVQRGYQVAGSASPKNHDFMTSLGASLTVDYADPAWAEKVRQWRPEGVEGALAIQPGTGRQCLKVVKDGGKIISISGDQFETERQIVNEILSHERDIRKELAQLYEQVASGQIKLVLEHEYPFEDGLKALAHVSKRHARGKSVLVLNQR